MSKPLQGKQIAILVTDNFEQVELTSPRQALLGAGATVHILSAKAGEVRGMNHDEKADSFKVDATWDDASPDDYAGVLLPGGVFNSDAIRVEPGAQSFVQAVHEQGRPIAVICHGAWLLVSAGLVNGRQLTSYPTLQDDINNAGGTWVDEEVVLDGNFISSRRPDDLPAFNARFLEALQRGEPQGSEAPAPAQPT